MKKSFSYILLVILLGTGYLQSCTTDSSADSDPVNAREAFLGRWNVSETWTKLSYEVTITADPNSETGVFIYNFANTGSGSIPAGASVSGSVITLDPDQVIGEGLTINGSGNYSNSKIQWGYTLIDGATRIDAIATYSR